MSCVYIYIYLCLFSNISDDTGPNFDAQLFSRNPHSIGDFFPIHLGGNTSDDYDLKLSGMVKPEGCILTCVI